MTESRSTVALTAARIFDRALPGDPALDTLRRLQWLTLIIAGLAAASFVLTELLRVVTPGTAAVRIGSVLLLEILAFGMYGLCRSRSLAPSAKLTLGLAWQVAVGMVIGLFANQAAWPSALGLPGWSPVAVWVMLYPIVVPARVARTLAASTITSAMDPLSVLALTGLGFMPMPATDVMIRRFIPNVLAIGLGLVVSLIMNRMGEKIEEAREMGSYRLTALLGRGGMGEVWRADHQILARPAAVKIIRPDFLTSGTPEEAQEALARFEREAQATCLLRSPHTVIIYDFGRTADGTFYNVMEFLEGLDLQAIVKDFGPLPAERAVHFLVQACHSLEEAHASGMVHRDIKPSNLFACLHGAAADLLKVLDFGLVKFDPPGRKAEAALTRSDTITGTPQFMAPEQALQDAVVDWRADIYALACVGYFLVSGRYVFESDSFMKVLFMHASDAPVAPSRRGGADIPEALDRILLDCLAKKPEDRPQSCRELADRLRAIPFASPWTDERARAWWAEHRAPADPAPGARGV